MDFLTLDEYLTGARKIILAQKCYALAEDEDAISYVAQRMMLADESWNGESSRKTWRYGQAKYAIQKFLAKKRRLRKLNIKSLDYGWDMIDSSDNSKSKTLADMIADSESSISHEEHELLQLIYENVAKILTSKQLACFEGYFQNGESYAEVGRNLGISRQAVKDNIIRGIRNIKEWMLEQNL